MNHISEDHNFCMKFATLPVSSDKAVTILASMASYLSLKILVKLT